MPVILEEKDPKFGRTILWSVTEDDSFFRNALTESGLNMDHIAKWHPKRQKEWMSGRYLIQRYIDIPVVELILDAYGKPRFDQSGLHLSISHTEGMVGLQFHDVSIGLDLQIESDQIHRVAHKFCIDEDYAKLKGHFHERDMERITWSFKEAVFKAYGCGGLSYKDNIVLQRVREINSMKRLDINIEKEGLQIKYSGRIQLIGPYCMSQVRKKI